MLFQYIYPQRQPNLTRIEFTQLAKVAEAAEKYQIYTAIEICNIRMGCVSHYGDFWSDLQWLISEAFIEHPLEVTMYALRHGYEDLMDKSERKALELSPTAAFDCLTPQIYIAWVSNSIACNLRLCLRKY